MLESDITLALQLPLHFIGFISKGNMMIISTKNFRGFSAIGQTPATSLFVFSLLFGLALIWPKDLWAKPQKPPTQPARKIPEPKKIRCPQKTKKIEKKGAYGVVKIWCEDGQKRIQGIRYTFSLPEYIELETYRNNIPEGEFVLMDEKGKVVQLTQNRDGVFHGRYQDWSEYGKVSCTGQYDMGRRTGVWKIWKTSGKMTTCDFGNPATTVDCVDNAR